MNSTLCVKAGNGVLRGEALVAPRRLPDAHFTQGRALPSQGC